MMLLDRFHDVMPVLIGRVLKVRRTMSWPSKPGLHGILLYIPQHAFTGILIAGWITKALELEHTC